MTNRPPAVQSLAAGGPAGPRPAEHRRDRSPGVSGVPAERNPGVPGVKAVFARGMQSLQEESRRVKSRHEGVPA